jgi:hypothetical protein
MIGRHSMNDHVKSAFDLSSFFIVVGTLVEWLPALAAGLSVIWSLIRLWETATVKKWFKRK